MADERDFPYDWCNPKENVNKYIPKEGDIEITGDWLIENGFEVTHYNTYKRDYLVLVATTFKKTHRNKGVLFFHQKIVLNGHTFNHGRVLRYISQIPTLPKMLKKEDIVDAFRAGAAECEAYWCKEPLLYAEDGEVYYDKKYNVESQNQ